MKLSVAIMAHPVRKAWVGELVTQLDRDDVEIVYDPKPVSADPEQRWANGRNAWLAHDPTADYHLVLQDDAVPSPDLIAGLEKGLDQLGPHGFMSAFFGAGRPDQKAVHRAAARAKVDRLAWCATWSLNWGPAMIAPVATIEDMLIWCDQPKRADVNYDARIGRYYRDILGWACWYPFPSLIEHRDGPSLVGHGSRRAADSVWAGSALDLDWSATPAGGLDPFIDPEVGAIARLTRGGA